MRKNLQGMIVVACIALAGCASTQAIAPAEPEQVLLMGPPEPVAIELPETWSSLQVVADSMRNQTGTPGLALAVIRDGAIVDQAVSGAANVSTGAPLALGSRFHWGSTAKSLTGTVLARLFADGTMQPDTTVAQVFPELAMHDTYRAVTVAQLMRHEGAVPAYTYFGPPELDQFATYNGTPAQKRLAFVADVLREQPNGTPGGQFAYSNAGITLAAVMAERATGRAWEELVREFVFLRAQMTDAGFGLPATPANPDATRGHMEFPGQVIELLPLGMFSEINPMLAPSGDISSSIGDFARYALFHLRGLRGEVATLPRAAFETIHTPSDDAQALPGGARYTFGWEITDWPALGGARTHWHNGSNGAFYAEIRLVPELNMAVVIMANSGGPIAFSSEESLAAILENYRRN